jgi:hypothetical protein
MLLSLVAVLLGLAGLTSIAGAVTLTALSHPVPGELWVLGGSGLSALAALLVHPSTGATVFSPKPEPSPQPVQAYTQNVSTATQTVDTSHIPPEAHEALDAYLSGKAKPKLPAPPHDRSQGRDSPPARTAKLPPHPRVAPKTTRRATRTAKASARRR